ncbi:HAMP domain-containing protein [Neotabrizicola sp. sgz301269]|uniref:cache domain-containing protein n=1 Tax=Neotabrizicola sp. sgz301269 TaxID=3276282 RepID=UPI00376F7C13
MAQRHASAISLPTAVYGFVLLGAILFGIATTLLLFDRVAKAQASALEAAVNVRGHHAAYDFARALHQDWQTLKRLSERIVDADPVAVQSALDTVVGDGERVSWAGFATTDGVVQAASNSLLETADVSARPWFQRGLIGDFAGDVHDAQLLNQLLGGSEEEPLRFIDLAAQVQGKDGQLKGVLGFHVNFSWAEAYLKDTADSLGLDLYLVNQDGEAIMATDGTVPKTLDLQSFRAAAAGVGRSDREIWPDGHEYFTTVIPMVTQGDLPDFGWRMVARIPSDSFEAASDDLIRSLAIVVMVSVLFLLILTVGFSRLFLHPFTLLADNAKRIADGSDEYPLELRRTDELRRLSAALAQLQDSRS